ncbi:hypothetical protein AUC61_24025 [Pseudomonas sp. S25]|uniref:Helix-turn-helix domain-containing protein n=1 Tax=Pseudomonas maioricensis TaxID=1766623 RepID=A0ABS9ZPV9_9PSED|nr:hypothetical protein [Pseudomonas sp. S25]MCI8212604.1 hypothetical protein [Pseudomonas sp. S25]
MELNQWIETAGGAEQAGKLSPASLDVVAGLLGEKPRTVLSWYRKERIPSFPAGANIVLKSKGVVDWNGIYSPFAIKLFSGVKHVGS